MLIHEHDILQIREIPLIVKETVAGNKPSKGGDMTTQLLKSTCTLFSNTHLAIVTR